MENVLHYMYNMTKNLEDNVIFIPTKQLIKLNPIFLEKLSWVFEIELIFIKENFLTLARSTC